MRLHWNLWILTLTLVILSSIFVSRGDHECAARCDELQFTPVCGTDKETYANDCLFQAAACMNSTLEIAYVGECILTENPNVDEMEDAAVSYCAIKCSAEYAPVCGSDNITYGNNCMLLSAKCGIPTLAKQSDGECPDASNCSQKCNPEYNPVCGSDGTTYLNKCEFGKEQCHVGEHQLIVANDGMCLTIAPEKSVCAQHNIICNLHQSCEVDQASGKPYCADFCDETRCEPTEVCVMKQIQCFTTPCPPIAECVMLIPDTQANDESDR